MTAERASNNYDGRPCSLSHRPLRTSESCLSQPAAWTTTTRKREHKGALKMRQWKMQEWKMREHIAGVENAGVENAGATKYGKPSEKILLSTRRNMAVVASCVVLAKRNSQASRPVNVATLLLIIIDSVSDVSRVTRGLAIRRAKKSVNLTNDKRMKICFAEI